MYGYRGFAAVTASLFVATLVVRDPPLYGFHWDALGLSGLCWFSALSCLFSLRFTGRHWPKFERGVLVNLALSSLIALLGNPQAFRIVVACEGLLNMPLLLLAAGLLAHFWWKTRTVESLLLCAGIALEIGFAAHDIAFFAGLIPFESIFLMPYGAAFGSLISGGVLVNRFVRHLNDYEALNVELESRVMQKHAELKANYQRMQVLERESAIVEERQRIMRDMHDGLGSQLISTLSLVEHGDLDRGRVVAILRECLDDLRLTVDSLESAENDLLTVLGNFRYRLEPRLRAQHIQLDWRVSDLPKLACLTPRNVLHILRVLQEAFTNIVKHAHAHSVRVETGVDEQHDVFMRVCDDGIGMVDSAARHGHGLANMRRRIEAIGGRFDISTSGGGTTVSVMLPTT